MAIISKTAVSLRISGDDLDPDEVTKLLGAEPHKGVRKGDIWHAPNGKPMTARTGAWHFRTEEQIPGDFDLQIAQLLSGLTDDRAIWVDLSKRFNTELFCGAFMQEWNEGTGLSAKTILALAQRGLRFELDLYGPPGEHPPE